MDDRITSQEVLDGENVEGEIYRCDVKRFFGWGLNMEKVDKIHKVLMEIKDRV